jgi:hypothetical protein
MKKLSGGGIQSNKLVNVGVKSGPPRTNVVSPASADQVGQTVAFKKDPLPIRTAQQVPMGECCGSKCWGREAGCWQNNSSLWEPRLTRAGKSRPFACFD